MRTHPAAVCHRVWPPRRVSDGMCPPVGNRRGRRESELPATRWPQVCSRRGPVPAVCQAHDPGAPVQSAVKRARSAGEVGPSLPAEEDVPPEMYEDAMSTLLAEWENVCIIVGSSAGALTGLLFVVITLSAGR